MRTKIDNRKSARVAAYRRGIADGLNAGQFLMRPTKSDPSKYEIHVGDAWAHVGQTLKRVMDDEKIGFGGVERINRRQRFKSSAE